MSLIIPLPLRWQMFQLWKRGNAADEYEDAAAGDVECGRFALADGASEASFAGAWARQLVTQFVADPGKPWRDLDWVEPLRHEWAKEVDGLSLAWYAEQKREWGAFATFLGLAFRGRAAVRRGLWKTVAVGDCCLFHTRSARLVQTFPCTRAADFGNRPNLVGSRSSTAELDAVRQHARGSWRSGDTFFLMTDALAQWCFTRLEQGRDPFAEIRDLRAEASADEAFAGWVEERRQHGQMRNDDVTMIVVDVEPA
jgi:hypothetical protein